MDENLNILIKQATQSIEHDKGMAAMFASSADEKQKLLSALLIARSELQEKEQQYNEERAARERAEAALEKERQRPLNYTCNVTLPDNQENESFYPRKNKYVEVVEWLAQQKKQGVDYYAAAGFNRSEMCRKLTKIFGWEVDQNSLRKAGF